MKQWLVLICNDMISSTREEYKLHLNTFYCKLKFMAIKTPVFWKCLQNKSKMMKITLNF